MSEPLSPDGIPAAIGPMPSGLYIVTCGDGSNGTGFLASFVQQLGFEPPCVTIAVGRDRPILANLREFGAFCVNVLADGDREHLSRFAKGPPEGNAFVDLLVETGPATGCPILPGTLAQFECRLLGEAGDWTDHVLLAGEVVTGRRSSQDRPAVHVRRSGASY